MTDFRYAFRQLIKSPSFSLIAIVALALGIGATTAMFAVIYAFLLRPLPYANPDQLIMLQSRGVRTGNDLGVNYLDFVDWQKQSRSFADLAFFNLRWNGNVESPGGMTETLKTTFTTANLFSLLGVQPMLGRDLTRADDEPKAAKVMLISERLWKKSFGGDPNLIGRDIPLAPRIVWRRIAHRLRECQPASARPRHNARTRALGSRRAWREPLAAGAAGPHRKRVARGYRQRRRRPSRHLAGGRSRGVHSR